MANAPGDGSITPLANGRFWVRSPVIDGKRKGLGTFATRELANEHLISFLCLKATPNAISPNLRTFGRFAPEVLDLREQDGTRGVAKERDRYRFHLADCLLTDMALADIKPQHIAELSRNLMRKLAHDKRGKRKIRRSTVQRVIAIVSSVFNEAVERGYVTSNPCQGIKVKRRAEDADNTEIEYADPADQERLRNCEAIPLVDRLIIRFAIGTGIRQGELCHQLLSDLHVEDDGATYWQPHLFVRFGKKNLPPKSKKTRTVQIFGDALVAITEYLELLKAGEVATSNPEGLIFPTKTGCRRQSGKPLGNGRKIKSTTDPRGWEWEGKFEGYCRAAGLTKHLRWHDLRHTCASSLVAGWWGRVWTLEEIMVQLGHSSILMTQRYAHLGLSSIKVAAGATPGPGYAVVTGLSGGCTAMASISNDLEEVGRAGVEPATYGLKGRESSENNRVVSLLRTANSAVHNQPSNPAVSSLVAAVESLLSAGLLEEAAKVAKAIEALTAGVQSRSA